MSTSKLKSDFALGRQTKLRLALARSGPRPGHTYTDTYTVCSIHSPRITLTLFSLLPCHPSSTRRPRRSPQRSRTTRTRRYSSRITSISSKLRLAPCARWHSKRSTPCAFLSPSPVNRYRGCLPSADEDLSCLFSKGAYQPGSSPTHAAGINVLLSSILNQHSWLILSESLAALRQCLRTLNELLYTTGVGSLPLLPPEATQPLTEEQLADQANKAISTLFSLHTRMQETAAVAASIMAAPEQAPRR